MLFILKIKQTDQNLSYSAKSKKLKEIEIVNLPLGGL